MPTSTPDGTKPPEDSSTEASSASAPGATPRLDGRTYANVTSGAGTPAGGRGGAHPPPSPTAKLDPIQIAQIAQLVRAELRAEFEPLLRGEGSRHHGGASESDESYEEEDSESDGSSDSADTQ